MRAWALPLPDQQDVRGLLELRGRAVLTAPFSKNAGAVTAVLAQYKESPGSDGHYVVFDIPTANRQASEFLGTLARRDGDRRRAMIGDRKERAR